MSEQSSIEGQTIIKAVARIVAAQCKTGLIFNDLVGPQSLWNFFETNLDKYKKKDLKETK